MTSTECEFYRVNRKMITVLGLRGDTLAVYALIASFSKGARGGFYGNYKHLAEWLSINERTVKDIIPKLMKARYIVKGEKPNCQGTRSYYFTNYEQLLKDVEAGYLPIIPCPKRRGVCLPVAKDHQPGGQIPLPVVVKDHQTGGQIPPATVVKDHKPSGQIPPAAVVKYHQTGGQIPPHNKYNKDILRMFIDCCSNEESDYNEDNDFYFYVVFFILDVSNPEKEVQSFVNYNYQHNWQNSKGRRYRSLKSRVALAYSYANKEATAKGRLKENACEHGFHLSNEPLNRKFLFCLLDLYLYASENHLEGLNPRLILNPNSFCFYQLVQDSKYDLIWYVGTNTKRWMEGHYDELIMNVIKVYFPDMVGLRFEIATSRLKMI